MNLKLELNDTYQSNNNEIYLVLSFDGFLSLFHLKHSTVYLLYHLTASFSLLQETRTVLIKEVSCFVEISCIFISFFPA